MSDYNNLETKIQCYKIYIIISKSILENFC